jgi:hypothetical protein
MAGAEALKYNQRGRRVEKVKTTPQAKLKAQIECLRDCSKHLSDLAPDFPPDTETIALIAKNLQVTADYAANLLELHSAQEKQSKPRRKAS